MTRRLLEGGDKTFRAFHSGISIPGQASATEGRDLIRFLPGRTIIIIDVKRARILHV